MKVHSEWVPARSNQVPSNSDSSGNLDGTHLIILTSSKGKGAQVNTNTHWFPPLIA